jgi:hypothetical protein
LDDLDIELLVEDGSIDSVDWSDEYQDWIITWNLKILEVKHPSIFQEVQDLFNQEIAEAMDSLSAQGLIEPVSINEDGEWLYQLTEDGKSVVEEINEEG